MALRLKDRPIGPRHGGRQLLRAEGQTRIDQLQSRPHVVAKPSSISDRLIRPRYRFGSSPLS